MFPNFFSYSLGTYPSLPTCSLAINRQRYFSAPLLFLCAEFLRPVLNLIFSVLSKGVSPRYKALNSFPIIMRKRKFFSHHHTSESLYLIPTFNLSLAKQSECSRFFILFEILFPAFCKSKFLHIFGRFKPSARKVKTFHFCHEVCHKLFPLLAALLFVSTMTESFLCLLNLPVYGGPLNAPYSADLFCCYVSLIRYIRPPSRHEYFPGLIRCHTVFNRYI